MTDEASVEAGGRPKVDTRRARRRVSAWSGAANEWHDFRKYSGVMNKTASSLILADGNGLQWLDTQPAAAGSESGFSLVEVLLAAGLISFLLVGTAELLIQSIQVQRKSDQALRIAGVMAAQSERVKTLPFDAGELASGNHEIEIALQPGDELVTLAWTVEDEGTSLKKVNFKLSRAGNAARPLEAVLLISRDLGF